MDTAAILSFIVLAVMVNKADFKVIPPQKKARLLLVSACILLISGALLLSPGQLGLGLACLCWATMLWVQHG